MKKLLMGLVTVLILLLGSGKSFSQELALNLEESIGKSELGFIKFNGFTTIFNKNSISLFDKTGDFKLLYDNINQIEYQLEGSLEEGKVTIKNT